jgi:hypothetical protein
MDINIQLEVQKRVRDGADRIDGACEMAGILEFPKDCVLLSHAPLTFPKMPAGREFAIKKATRLAPGVHWINPDSKVTHTVVRQISTTARLLVPIPPHRSSRRLLDLMLLLDRAATANRIDEELAEIFQTLLPHRVSNAKLYRAINVTPRTLRERSTESAT